LTKRNRSRGGRLFLRVALFIILPVMVLIALGGVWWFALKPNTSLRADKSLLYIRTGATLSDVTDSLVSKGIINDVESFTWLANQKKYSDNIRPGRYRLRANMSNNALVNLLRSGSQDPVKITFNTIRLKQDLANKIGSQLECGSIALLAVLRDPAVCNKYGFDTTNILAIFIPNTYNFKWNTDANKFISRMAAEYKKWWTPERKQQAAVINLSQTEVSILASIVEQESNLATDKPIIAGVYWNRLQRDMKLEADPTVKYALQEFGLKRILNKHIVAGDNRYNTYLYKGLPPGPICIPSVSSLQATLDLTHHNYIFFCARPDLSGYHDFAENMTLHLANARNYHKKMNEMKL